MGGHCTERIYNESEVGVEGQPRVALVVIVAGKRGGHGSIAGSKRLGLQ